MITLPRSTLVELSVMLLGVALSSDVIVAVSRGGVSHQPLFVGHGSCMHLALVPRPPSLGDVMRRPGWMIG